ncbi:winged helix-turn-helix domain-containing protein [Acidianus sp. HS-5]|uniref:winged helix-turn-helix domain-containing protein n=1 Tax=Acidianus sp. HS-5 TaxID=2886040 RepID=UPI001F15B5C1|nr:winged helix-turn-helix domain-containing protein [Acidianus sp. HS-5]BDC18983.1 transcriptional regulator [Acidianus sp. HS-5]
MESINNNETRKRIYYYLLKQGKPIGLKKIQRDLGISSPSLVHYHLKKLEEQGLVKETQEGYIINKVIISEFVKVANHLIPISGFWSSFFLTSLALEIILLLSGKIIDSAVFGSIIIGISSALSIKELIRKYKETKLW